MSRVIIIEDSVFQRSIIKKIVQEAGHEVLEAESGKEGLRKIEDYHPDLILLDLLMPDIDGFQVLKILKSKHNKTPVVVITADVQQTTRQQCMEDGARQIVNKPVEASKLSGIINEILDT
ncbi:MAG: response regulator [Desulfonatronovibrio sp.]